MSLELTARLVYTLNMFEHFFEIENVELDFYPPVVRYASSIKKDLLPDWNLAITGHSLGAGIATIVGGTIGIDSIAFSPPGMTASRYKFETKLDQKYVHPELELSAQHTVSFLPLRDAVPKADGHFGLVQNTICHYKDPLLCHSIELAVCDLIRRCGDGHGGKRFVGCSFKTVGMFENDRQRIFPNEACMVM